MGPGFESQRDHVVQSEFESPSPRDSYGYSSSDFFQTRTLASNLISRLGLNFQIPTSDSD